MDLVEPPNGTLARNTTAMASGQESCAVSYEARENVSVRAANASTNPLSELLVLVLTHAPEASERRTRGCEMQVLLTAVLDSESSS